MDPKGFIMENLRQRTLQGRLNRAMKDDVLRLENQRIAERTAKIREFSKTNSEEVVPLLLEEVLESIGQMADKGERFTCWCPAREIDETKQDKVVDKLKGLGLEVKVICGHGHTPRIACRGRSSYNCWPSVMISWDCCRMPF